MRHILILFLTASLIAIQSGSHAVISQPHTPEVSTNTLTGKIAGTKLIRDLHNKLQEADSEIPYSLLEKGMKGYLNLKNTGIIAKDVITLIDMEKPGTEKRMWVIDVAQAKILKRTYVAHGKNSGNNYATSFSNIANSYQSSLGFYVTGQTYHGKHGLSLRLDGMDTGFNDNARQRAIVLHGASYVSDDFIKQYGRLGRSHGCPAVPVSENKEIIDLIKGGSLLFISGSCRNYQSDYLAG